MKEYICIVCGGVFEAKRKRKYCSLACKARANRDKKNARDKQYYADNRDRIGARRSAQMKAKRAAPGYEKPRIQSVTYTCQHCGKDYHPKSNERNTYCSRECAYKAKRIVSEERKQTEATAKVKRDIARIRILTCPVCGEMFVTASQSKYVCCNNTCYKQYMAAISMERYFVPVREKNPYIKKICKECGKEYEVNYMADVRVFCSDKCSSRNGHRNGKARRRMRMREQYVAPVNMIDIYNRDGGVCQLCGERVDMRCKVPHPRAATIDHIIPLAEWGTHGPKNVQLAHFMCNSAKGTRAKGSQLRML